MFNLVSCNAVHQFSIGDVSQLRSVLGVDWRSRTSEQKITSGRSPLCLITFISLLM